MLIENGLLLLNKLLEIYYQDFFVHVVKMKEFFLKFFHVVYQHKIWIIDRVSPVNIFFCFFCFSQFYFLVMKYQSQVYQKLRVNIFFYILKFKITLNFSYLHRVLQQFYPCLILIIQQLHVI